MLARVPVEQRQLLQDLGLARHRRYFFVFVGRLRQASLNSLIVSIVRGFHTILRRIGGVTVGTCAPASSASLTSMRWRIEPTMILDGRPSRSITVRVASITGRTS